MKVKIAAFGTRDTIERVKQLTAERKGIEILPFIYTKAEETAELIEKVFTCDFYLFTNPIAYLYVKEKIEKKRLPAIQVDFDPYTIVRSLYQLQKELEHAVDKVGVDITSEDYINELRAGLQLKNQKFSFYLHDPSATPNPVQIVSHYEEQWKKGEIEYVLTTLDEVVTALSEKDIPSRSLKPTDLNLLKAIDKGVALTELNQAQNTQIVTGNISIKGLEEITDSEAQYKEDLLNKLSKIIKRFTKRTDGTLIHKTDDTFILIGTDKMLHHLKEHYRDFPLLQEMKTNIKLPIHMGFGLGLNPKESTANAALALESCRRSEHSICYIMNERQEIIGPIGIKKEIDTSSLYKALIHDARLNNELSYNFIDFITERNNEPFSTNDVALFYQVTKRSAERTVNKLLTGNVIKISGEERPYTKGRPRKLFTLDQ